MNSSTKFQLHPPYLAFRLPWQPIKFSGLDKILMVGRGLLKERYC